MDNKKHEKQTINQEFQFFECYDEFKIGLISNDL